MDSNEWIVGNQERIDKLSEEVINRMDIGDLEAYVKDALERSWATDRESFEVEWKEYQREIV
jgi:hypothetical protein